MKRKKKRLSTVLLCALGAVVLAAGAAAVWQWNNISAFLVSRQHSAAELEEMLIENEKNTETILEKLPYVSLRPLTEDEKGQLHRGELTEDEVVERILSQPVPGSGAAPADTGAAAGTDTPPGADAEPAAPPAAPTAPTAPTAPAAPAAPAAPPAAPTAPPAADEKQARVAALIARIYVLRESMTGRLEGIVNTAKAEYNALPKDQRTGAKKGEFAARCLREAADLERQCDASIDTILKELETLLRETGGDMGLVAEIRQAYATEKSVKKSYFINQYS